MTVSRRSRRRVSTLAFHSLSFVPLAFLSLTLVSGCGGSGGDSPGAFEVKSFSADGVTGIERNRPLVVTFTAPVDPASVSAAGLGVRIDGALFPLRAVVEGNVVTLHPTVLAGERNDFVPPTDPPPNGLGFPRNARLEIEISGAGALSVRDLRGRKLGATFRAPFGTGSGFVPEEPAVAPVLAAPPAFNQVPKNEFDFDARDPETAPEFDPRDLRVSLTFSEPMDPSAFDPFDSFTVTNVTPGFRHFGREIPGEIVADGESRAFTFVPMLPLGDDPDSAEPLLFRIRLEDRLAADPSETRRLRDLAGNALEGNPDVDGHAGRLVEPIDFWFKTVDAPGLPRYDWFTETFDDAANEDRDREIDRRAIWGEDGLLRGAPPVRSVIEVAPPDSLLPMPEPLTPSGNRVQLLYHHAELGSIGPSTLVALEWGPRGNALLAATYANMSLSIGHSDLTIFSLGLRYDFASNFTRAPGNPVRVFQGDYAVPGGPSGAYHPWPAFENVFEYDGASSIVVDLDVPAGAAAFQSFRANSSIAGRYRRIVGPPGSTTAALPPAGISENTICHHRFTFVARRSLAVSVLVDTGAADPLYLEPLVRLVPTGPATSLRLAFEGEDVYPGTEIPNGARLGPFDDVDSLAGIRFFSFQFELTGDLESSDVPLVESLTVAWEIR